MPTTPGLSGWWRKHDIQRMVIDGMSSYSTASGTSGFIGTFFTPWWPIANIV